MIIRYDYKVLPGPVTSEKSKGLRDINNKKLSYRWQTARRV